MLITRFVRKQGILSLRAFAACGVFIMIRDAVENNLAILTISSFRCRKEGYIWISSSAQGSRKSATYGKFRPLDRSLATMAFSKEDIVAKMRRASVLTLQARSTADLTHHCENGLGNATHLVSFPATCY